MPVVTATQLKTSTSDVFDLLAKDQAVVIHRHEKPRAVLVSVERYESLVGKESDLLADLMDEYKSMLVDMQSPEQKAAAIRAFNATPEELGKAAVLAAQHKVASGEIIV
jgi:prevent-host-death family protein